LRIPSSLIPLGMSISVAIHYMAYSRVRVSIGSLERRLNET
jgi:hypothetical protein